MSLGILCHLIMNILTADVSYDAQHKADSYKCLFHGTAIFVMKQSSCSTM